MHKIFISILIISLSFLTGCSKEKQESGLFGKFKQTKSLDSLESLGKEIGEKLPGSKYDYYCKGVLSQKKTKLGDSTIIFF